MLNSNLPRGGARRLSCPCRFGGHWAAGPVSGVCRVVARCDSVHHPGQGLSGRCSGVTRERCGRATLESDSLRVSTSPSVAEAASCGRCDRLGFVRLKGFGPAVERDPVRAVWVHPRRGSCEQDGSWRRGLRPEKLGVVELAERNGLGVAFGSCTIGWVAYCCTGIQAPRGSVERRDRGREGWLLRPYSVVAPKGTEGWRSACERRESNRRIGRPQGRLRIPLEKRRRG